MLLIGSRIERGEPGPGAGACGALRPLEPLRQAASAVFERVVLCSCDGDWPLLRTSRCVLSLPGPNCARRCGEFPLGHQYFGVVVPDAGTLFPKFNGIARKVN